MLDLRRSSHALPSLHCRLSIGLRHVSYLLYTIVGSLHLKTKALLLPLEGRVAYATNNSEESNVGGNNTSSFGSSFGLCEIHKPGPH